MEWASRDSHDSLAETINKLALGGSESVEQAIDRFDDNAPLRETFDGAERVEACLHFRRNSDAELRIVLHLLP